MQFICCCPDADILLWSRSHSREIRNHGAIDLFIFVDGNQELALTKAPARRIFVTKETDDEKTGRRYAFLKNASWYLTCRCNSNFLGHLDWKGSGKKVKTKRKGHSVQWTRDVIMFLSLCCVCLLIKTQKSNKDTKSMNFQHIRHTCSQYSISKNMKQRSQHLHSIYIRLLL